MTEKTRKDIDKIRRIIYGYENILGNEDKFVERYERHNREVTKYFKGRDEDILVVDLTKGAGWEQICPFLGKEVPDIPFPHLNIGNYGKVSILGRLSKKRLY